MYTNFRTSLLFMFLIHKHHKVSLSPYTTPSYLCLPTSIDTNRSLTRSGNCETPIRILLPCDSSITADIDKLVLQHSSRSKANCSAPQWIWRSVLRSRESHCTSCIPIADCCVVTNNFDGLTELCCRKDIEGDCYCCGCLTWCSRSTCLSSRRGGWSSGCSWDTTRRSLICWECASWSSRVCTLSRWSLTLTGDICRTWSNPWVWHGWSTTISCGEERGIWPG